MAMGVLRRCTPVAGAGAEGRSNPAVEKRPRRRGAGGYLNTIRGKSAFSGIAVAQTAEQREPPLAAARLSWPTAKLGR